MNYKTIYVCLSDEADAKHLMTHACAVARQFDAHLVGLYAIQTVEVYPTVSMYMSAEVTASMADAQKQEADRIKAVFDAATGGENFPSEWRLTTASQPSVGLHLAEMCRCADLVIMSQADPENKRSNQESVIREVIEQSGRPVLVMPRYGDFNGIGTHIMVGWSATLESTRALYNAMPFISHSDETQIFWVWDSDTRNTELEDTGHELAKSLSRHGANASVKHYQKGSLSIGDELLNAASDSGINLIVTGAFGHSKLYDFVVGAATNHLLRHMTVPVLFSK